MKYLINFVLLLLIVAFGYFLYNSIAEPIEFNTQKKKREVQVVKNLQDIRTSQELYREITDTFANNFDSLIYVLKNGKIPVIKTIGNPDEITSVDDVEYDTIYFSAIDSINVLKINLDSLKYIPFSNNKIFNISADEIDYQKTKVNVVEVSTMYKDFMGKYADKKYQKYATGYDPEKYLKFGDMNTPNLTGNWE